MSIDSAESMNVNELRSVSTTNPPFVANSLYLLCCGVYLEIQASYLVVAKVKAS